MYPYSMDDLLTFVLNQGGSDLHVVVGCPPRMRLHGSLQTLVEEVIGPEDAAQLVLSIMSVTEQDMIRSDRELDFAYSLRGKARFRVNAAFERDSLMLAARVIPVVPVPLEELGYPQIVTEMTNHPRGLILCTGPAGSGKTTTLASMIDFINRKRAARIITIEDPIEYMHQSQLSTISQREVGRDTLAFRNALRSALRQDPDVILVGEMRDLETIGLALTAAETGQLVFATMHTLSAGEAVNRIIDAFPPDQQEQIRTQLTGTLEAVFTQCLVPRSDGKGRVGAMEVLIGTPAVRNLIREGKPGQIDNAIATGSNVGMQTLEKHLAKHVIDGVVSLESAMMKARRPEDVKRVVGEKSIAKTA